MTGRISIVYACLHSDPLERLEDIAQQLSLIDPEDVSPFACEEREALLSLRRWYRSRAGIEGDEEELHVRTAVLVARSDLALARSREVTVGYDPEPSPREVGVTWGRGET